MVLFFDFAHLFNVSIKPCLDLFKASWSPTCNIPTVISVFFLHEVATTVADTAVMPTKTATSIFLSKFFIITLL